MINDANAWKQAQNIREYVYAVQENIGIEQKAYFKMWSAWAFQCADEIDPMKRMNFKKLPQREFWVNKREYLVICNILDSIKSAKTCVVRENLH